MMIQNSVFARLVRKKRFDTRDQNIGSCKKGATSVEFALIIVPLLVLIFGTLQNLLFATAKLTLDSALQTVAYEAANANPTDVFTLLSRQNLCRQSALFLVSCNSGSELCFSIVPLSSGTSTNEPHRACQAKTVPINPAECCYQLIAEYEIPAIFDVTRSLMFISGSPAAPRTVRSVAFMHRS